MQDEDVRHDPIYEPVRRMVEQELREEKEKRARSLFQLNATLFGIVVTIGWLVFFPALGADETGRSLLGMAILSILAATQVGIHWVVYRLNNSNAERLLREAIREMVGSEVVKEKAKRHLDVDGTRLEVTDVDADADLAETDVELRRKMKR